MQLFQQLLKRVNRHFIIIWPLLELNIVLGAQCVSEVWKIHCLIFVVLTYTGIDIPYPQIYFYFILFTYEHLLLFIVCLLFKKNILCIQLINLFILFFTFNIFIIKLCLPTCINCIFIMQPDTLLIMLSVILHFYIYLTYSLI